MSQLPCCYSISWRTFNLNGRHTLKLNRDRDEMLQFCRKREDKAGTEPRNRRKTALALLDIIPNSLLQVARVLFCSKQWRFLAQWIKFNVSPGHAS